MHVTEKYRLALELLRKVVAHPELERLGSVGKDVSLFLSTLEPGTCPYCRVRSRSGANFKTCGDPGCLAESQRASRRAWGNTMTMSQKQGSRR